MCVDEFGICEFRELGDADPDDSTKTMMHAFCDRLDHRKGPRGKMLKACSALFPNDSPFHRYMAPPPSTDPPTQLLPASLRDGEGASTVLSQPLPAAPPGPQASPIADPTSRSDASGTSTPQPTPHSTPQTTPQLSPTPAAAPQPIPSLRFRVVHPVKDDNKKKELKDVTTLAEVLGLA